MCMQKFTHSVVYKQVKDIGIDTFFKMRTLFLFYGCGAGGMCMSSEAQKKRKSSGKWND